MRIGPRLCYANCMTRIERLEQEIAELSPAELEELRAWFAAFDAEEWDRQCEHAPRAARWIGWRIRRSPITGPDKPGPLRHFASPAF